ncbi:hypothetical protein [Tessaracoccus sp.]
MTEQNPTTANGVHLVDGLRVWDYDLELGTVSMARRFTENGEVWFHVFTDGDSARGEDRLGTLMSESRVATLSPFTREPAGGATNPTQP